MTLYELTGQFLELLQMAEEGDLDQKLINDSLEGVEFELEEKADAYANIISTLDGNAELLDKEIERLSARKKTLLNNITSIKRNLENSMLLTGKTKFKTTLHSYAIQKNAPTLLIVEESKIPKRFYIKQEPKLDRKALLEFIKQSTNPVKYAELKQTESLRIR